MAHESEQTATLRETLTHRFGEPVAVPVVNDTLVSMSARGSCRRFTGQAVDPEMVEQMAAIALASPTKSDLQQRDIIVLDDESLRHQVCDLLTELPWLTQAPVMLVFCGNNRRQRQISAWRNKPFPNDHLDAFFNASVDAGIALSAFVTAAESLGLGCCPISVIRNHAMQISEWLALPAHVFPVAGLALGWPQQPAAVSLRLPLSVTLHRNKFSDAEIQRRVTEYDLRRESLQPYAKQRAPEVFGTAPHYGWSEDKARQYARPERADFGAFVRAKGFSLD